MDIYIQLTTPDALELKIEKPQSGDQLIEHYIIETKLRGSDL